MASNITKVSNSFTGYKTTIKHKGQFPSVLTVKKHVKASKAKDCCSETLILTHMGDEVWRLHLDFLGKGLIPERIA
jgi:hypothetical protein